MLDSLDGVTDGPPERERNCPRFPKASEGCIENCRMWGGIVLCLTVLTGCGAGSSADPTAAAAASHPSAAPTANLLFKSNFDPGVALGPLRDFSTKGAWQDLTGTDNETGYPWPVTPLAANFSGVQLIAVDPITPSTMGDYIKNEIRQVSGPHGTPVYELFQNVINPGAPGGSLPSQAPLMIRRTWNSDVQNLYITYWFKHQADLASQLEVPVGRWRVQFEFKTGGATDPITRLKSDGGDYRIATTILKTLGPDGQLYWRTKSDGNANGPYDGEGNICNDPHNTDIRYWCEDAHSVPVPIDVWFKYEIFWHRSNGSDGRFWSAVNGQVIVDHRGPNMGKESLPVTRIMVNNPYSGGNPPVESHTTGLEIWDGFPCGDGVSCYK